MKFRIITIFAVAGAMLCGCNKWLDIIPEDTTTEKQLFSDAGGYHAAINGLYQTLASSALYGKNLTWGFASALSQYYNNASSDNSKSFSYTEQYDYNSKEMLSYGENIWLTGYNVVANANNILQNLENADPNIFTERSKGEIELIKGEALAVRALVHFDLLRLFGVAPVVGKSEKAIPYVKEFPSFFSERLTVEQVIDNVVADLKEAEELLAITDTLNFPGGMNGESSRYLVSNGSRDYFFTGRGVRMNFVGIKALLARVYAYAGNMDAAYEQAAFICEKYVDEGSTGWYAYTKGFSDQDTEANRPHKLMSEILISFYDENLSLTYSQSTSSSQLKTNSYALKNLSAIFSEANDVRQRKLITNLGTDVKVSIKFNERTTGSGMMASSATVENKVIPVMRLSELKLIMAEALAAKGQMEEAVALLDELKLARGCGKSGMTAETSIEDFITEVGNEVRRENVAEGQYFFYCKRINAATIDNNGVFVPMDGNYTMRIPDSQVNLN